MAIEKINFSYPKGTLQSVFDNEALTALELSAKTSKKVDECVEIVNGVEQTAIEATAIVDDMYLIQSQFVTDNSDTRAQLILDNQTYLDGLEASTVVMVNSKIDTLVTNGTIETIINENILNGVKDNIVNNELAFSDTTGYGIISGLEVKSQSTPNMTVLISSGIAHLTNGKRYTLIDNATIPIETADASYNRIDVIYINSDMQLIYGKGVASSSPIAPTPANSIILAEISVVAGIASIINSSITDKRLMKYNLPVIGNKVEDHNSRLNDICINVKSFGAKGDGITDDTQAIQFAIDYVSSIGGGTVFIPDGDYRIIYGTGIYPKSNMTIKMATNTILRAIPNPDATFGSVIRLSNVKNVTIDGGTLIGDKDQKTPGLIAEWCHGITVTANYPDVNENITIKNTVIHNCYGDGIATYRTIGLNILNNHVYNCHRNGIALATIKRSNISGNIVHDVKGTDPQAGICIEPDVVGGVPNFTAEEINVNKNILYKNFSSDIICANASGLSNVIITDNIMTPEKTGVYISTYIEGNKMHSITVSNNQFIMTSGIIAFQLISAENIVISNNIIDYSLNIKTTSLRVFYIGNYNSIKLKKVVVSNNVIVGNTYTRIFEIVGLIGDLKFIGNKLNNIKELIYGGGTYSADIIEVINNSVDGASQYVFMLDNKFVNVFIKGNTFMNLQMGVVSYWNSTNPTLLLFENNYIKNFSISNPSEIRLFMNFIGSAIIKDNYVDGLENQQLTLGTISVKAIAKNNILKGMTNPLAWFTGEFAVNETNNLI